MSKSESEITWKDNILMCAQRFSRVMEERFQIEIQSGKALLPPPFDSSKHMNEEAAVEMLEFYFEYMFGTAVALSCHYANTSEEFEENIVALVRDKFAKIRKMEK